MLIKILVLTSFLFCSLVQGQVVTEDPKQEDFVRPFIVAEKDDYKIIALAKFEITARVLGVESYSMDAGSKFSPYDFALGWKSMSSEEFLSKIKIRQSNRFYYWYTQDAITYSQKNKIITQSANMHLIPATPQVKRILGKAKTGKNFYIKGYLVKITKDNYRWTSSMVRTDSGLGACELIWVVDAVPM